MTKSDSYLVVVNYPWAILNHIFLSSKDFDYRSLWCRFPNDESTFLKHYSYNITKFPIIYQSCYQFAPCEGGGPSPLIDTYEGLRSLQASITDWNDWMRGLVHTVHRILSIYRDAIWLWYYSVWPTSASPFHLILPWHSWLWLIQMTWLMEVHRMMSNVWCYWSTISCYMWVLIYIGFCCFSIINLFTYSCIRFIFIPFLWYISPQ